jgi:hypothetical protein
MSVTSHIVSIETATAVKKTTENDASFWNKVNESDFVCPAIPSTVTVAAGGHSSTDIAATPDISIAVVKIQDIETKKKRAEEWTRNDLDVLCLHSMLWLIKYLNMVD